MSSHYEATEERIKDKGEVLVVQDSSSLNYTGLGMTEGLGTISTSEDKSVGLILHNTMAFTTEGTPLGLVDVQCWARDKDKVGSRYQRHSKAIGEKESNKWLKSYRAVCEIQKRCPNTKIIVMGDRETDIHELFVEHLQRSKGAELHTSGEESKQEHRG